MFRCERQIARLDGRWRDDALYGDWIAVDSRSEAIAHLALLGEQIEADHLCDHEVGQRTLARLDARSFPEAIGAGRAAFPAAPGAPMLRDLFFRSLAKKGGGEWGADNLTVEMQDHDLAEAALEDVYENRDDGGLWDLAAAASTPSEMTVDNLPCGSVFHEIREAWDRLPPEDGLVSVARGMRGVFRMTERFPGADGERGFTHLALLSVPMLVRRYCGTQRPIGFLSGTLRRRSDEFRSSIHEDDRAWVRTFVDLLADALADTRDKFSTFMLLRNELLRVAAGKRKNAKMRELITLLFRQPTMTIATATENLGVSDRATSSMLQELAEAGFLRVRGNRTRYRVWEAYRILELIRRR